MAEDGQAGLSRHPSGGMEHLVQQRSHASPGYTGLQDARLTVCTLNAVGAVAHQQVVDLLLVPEAQPGFLLIVEAGGRDDVQPRAAGHLPHQVDVTAQVYRRAVHHGGHALLCCLAQHPAGHLGHLVPFIEAGTKVHPHGPVGTGQMLVHQHLAQVGRIHRTQYALDLHISRSPERRGPSRRRRRECPGSGGPRREWRGYCRRL